MHFKLIIALVDDAMTDDVLHAAREEGAMGATVINHARGEGVEGHKTFFGLTMTTQRDVLLFLVEEHLSRRILETIEDAGGFQDSNTGIAFQVDVEDVVGIAPQVAKLETMIEEKL